MALTIALSSCEGRPLERPQMMRLVVGSAGRLPGQQGPPEEYSLPHARVIREYTPGSVVVISRLQAAEAEFGVAQADIVYTAYRSNRRHDSAQPRELAALAVLSTNNFYVLARRDTPYRRLEDLRGRRVVVSREGGASEPFTRMVIAAHNMSYSDMKVDFVPWEDIGSRFASSNADAMLIVSSLPPPTISGPTPPEALRLIPISADSISALRTKYPFITPVYLPADTIPGQHDSIATVGVDTMLISRRDLNETLVYEFIKQYLGRLESRGRFKLDIDFAAITPIPLHPGAARFYREREILR